MGGWQGSSDVGEEVNTVGGGGGGWGCGCFFFQAEDGIRDDLVTGVQTCALPILLNCRQNFKRHNLLHLSTICQLLAMVLVLSLVCDILNVESALWTVRTQFHHRLAGMMGKTTCH